MYILSLFLKVDNIRHHTHYYNKIKTLICLHITFNSIELLQLQTATGLTIEQANVPSFGKALQKTVSSFLGVSVTAVSGTTFAANRRKLLASVGVYYVVSVNSGISSDGLISLLQKAVADGRFLAALKANSGISITGISSLVILGFTPTSLPSKAPVSTTLLGMPWHCLYCLFEFDFILLDFI